MKYTIILLSIIIILAQNTFANNSTFSISKQCSDEDKKFRSTYDSYMSLLKTKQFSSSRYRLVKLKLHYSIISIICPYDLMKYETSRYNQAKDFNDQIPISWMNKPLIKETLANNTRKQIMKNDIKQNTLQISDKEQKGILKNKYKNTPTIYIKGRIIYDIQDINYFRKDKMKIIVKGKERSYVFPIQVLKKAKFENATDELLERFNSLVNKK